MGLEAASGARRPGGRTAETRRRVLLASQEELIRHGYADFSVARVATRAGVHKTTVYRRWGDRTHLVAEVMTVIAETSVPIPATGSLLDDLRRFADELTVLLADRGGLIVRALVAAAATDAGLHRQLSRFFADRYAAAEVMIEQAAERGEVSFAVSPAAVIRAVAAPLYYTLLVLGRSPTAQDADDAVRAAWGLAMAG